MLNLLEDLVYSSKKLDKNKNIWETIFILLGASLISTLGTISSLITVKNLVLKNSYTKLFSISASFSIGIFILSALGAFLFSYLLLLGFKLLNKSGNYKKAMIATGLSLSLLSIGFLLSVIILMIPSSIYELSFLLLISGVLMIVVMYSSLILLIKLCSELFKADLLTTLTATIPIIIVWSFITFKMLSIFAVTLLMSGAFA